MFPRPTDRRMPLPRTPRSQRGFGMYVVVMIIGAVATVTVASILTSRAIQTREVIDHASLLSESKRALIGWAITKGSTANPGIERPGDLPAPDVAISAEFPANYDGDRDNSGCLNSAAPSALTNYSANARCLGRLPWRDLQMAIQAPTEQDSAGRMPWYAVSANLTRIDICFKILNSETVNLPHNGFPADCTNGTPPTPPVASNPPYPWLTVRDNRGNIISNRVAFVVIIPGPVVSNQQRQASPNLGGASEYLDSMVVGSGCNAPCIPGTYSNADLDNDFIAGDITSTFNDKLLYVTIDELIEAIENQVANAVTNAVKTAATLIYTENPKTSLSPGTPRFFWLAPFNPGGTAYQSAAVGTLRGMLPEHLLDTTFSTGFQWSLSSTAPVTRSGTINSSEVRSHTVPAGQGMCYWGNQTVAQPPSLVNILRRVQCTATIINPESGVTRRTINLIYTGSTAPTTIPVSHNTSVANIVFSPATATSPISRSVTRTTLSSVTLQMIDYDDNSITWSWNPFTGNWVYGPEIVGYGTESAGSGYSITTSGISYYPSLVGSWYIANEWYKFIYIAIAPGYQPGGINSCATINSCFSIRSNNNNTQSSIAGIALSAGKALSNLGQARHNSTLNNYFEGSNNTTSNTIVFDRQKPTSETFNDQAVAITP